MVISCKKAHQLVELCETRATLLDYGSPIWTPMLSVRSKILQRLGEQQMNYFPKVNISKIGLGFIEKLLVRNYQKIRQLSQFAVDWKQLMMLFLVRTWTLPRGTR